ncbi:hypothetical protein DMC01_06200 [Campylobacter troglodytis]|nr:hypothetical protein DMC01_06200 [Campylobacter troglodytis]
MQKILVDQSLRLDLFLAKYLKTTRSQITSLIKNGGVRCNDQPCLKASFRVKIGDELEIIKLLPKSLTQKYPISFDIEVLYEDEDLLVLNKPSGIVMHSASSVKEATVVDWLLEKGYALSSLGGELRAGLVHRLDKGTSGAIIIAKNNHTHELLSKQLATKSLGRFYLALTDLPLKDDKLINEKAIIRCPRNRLKKMAVDEMVKGARKAKSAFINIPCKESLGKDAKENSSPYVSGMSVSLNSKTNFNEGLNSSSQKLLSKDLNSSPQTKLSKDFEAVNLNSHLSKDLNLKQGLKDSLKEALNDDTVLKNDLNSKENSSLNSNTDLEKSLKENSSPTLKQSLNINPCLSQNSSKAFILEETLNLKENSSTRTDDGLNSKERSKEELDKAFVKNEALNLNKDSQKNSNAVNLKENSQKNSNKAFAVSEAVNVQQNSSKEVDETVNLKLDLNKKVNEAVNSRLNSNKEFNETVSLRLNSSKDLNYTLNLRTNSSKEFNETVSFKKGSKKHLDKNINLIAAKLFTGRTHQIRAHLESLNRHILGDKLYGYKGKEYERVMLHSYFLYFIHPRTQKQMLIKAPLFEDFWQLLEDFDKEELDEKLSFDYLFNAFNTFS